MTETVFITGISGFVGHHLAAALRDRGYEVSGLARYVSDRNIDIDDGIDVRLGDITDSYRLMEVYRDVEPDHVVHLATQSSVKYSFDHPVESYDVGFMGTVNAAQMALAELPELQSFIMASSVEVYGNQDRSPLEERFQPNPASPYGVAKTASEYFVDYLHRARGFPAITFRSTNTYGRRYNHQFVVEHAIHDMLQGVDTLEMGHPEPVRDFLYIEDEVEAYVAAIEQSGDRLYGEILNTGTTRGISIRDLVALLAERIGWDGDVAWETNSTRPLEIDSLVIDNEKIASLLGWTPEYTLEDGLDETIEWWEQYLDRTPARASDG